MVLMGMGEPLANYKNVIAAIRRMNTEIGIGARHITVSTVGLVPRIERLSKEGLQIKLAVSLHAANDEERNAIMPVNVRFPLNELMKACRNYVKDTGRRITFEWALIAGKVWLLRRLERLETIFYPLNLMSMICQLDLHNFADALVVTFECLTRTALRVHSHRPSNA